MLVAKFSHCCYEIVKIANQHFIVYQKKKVFFFSISSNIVCHSSLYQTKKSSSIFDITFNERLFPLLCISQFVSLFYPEAKLCITSIYSHSHTCSFNLKMALNVASVHKMRNFVLFPFYKMCSKM